MADNLSRKHFKAVSAEIEGRFFAEDEAAALKEAIDDRTITDPKTRFLAAQTWEVPNGH